MKTESVVTRENLGYFVVQTGVDLLVLDLGHKKFTRVPTGTPIMEYELAVYPWNKYKSFDITGDRYKLFITPYSSVSGQVNGTTRL